MLLSHFWNFICLCETRVNEIKAIAIDMFECGKNNELSPQSTELSTEFVVMPVENVGEVEKSETDVALDV